MNGFKTLVLMSVMTFLLMALGGSIGGSSGMILALIVAGAGNILSYWFSDKLVLRAYKATPVPEGHKIWEMTKNLAENAGLPMPKVYIIDQRQPNAFATGRNPKNAAVAVTKGLAENLSDQELAGVIGHELGHIKNRDILISTIAATLAGAISYLGYVSRFGGGRRGSGGNNIIFFILAIVVAPVAASLIQMAISRTREYKADEFGALVSGNPRYLGSALNKLENWKKTISLKGNPSTAHMFIVHPFSGKAIDKLFSTHPKTADRIKRLKELEYSEDFRYKVKRL
jgi:heat shock protein HtpX